jgi:lipopolysaccharide export system protein LptA
MHFNRHQPDNFSQPDADLLIHLNALAESITPDALFKADLEAKLHQAYPSKLSQTTYQGTHPMKKSILPRLNRPVAFITCTSLAITAVFVIPTFTSGKTMQWLTTFLNPAINSKANAQTLAQAMATGEVTLVADTQVADETTQTVKATGNVVFTYPEAQIQAISDEGLYTTTSGQITLLGNVQITQRGETLQGTQATCSFEQKQCTLTRN